MAVTKKPSDDWIIVNFWGVRGTLPVSGANTLRFGGNTNCVTLNIGNENIFIFDAGTGIKSLSNYLEKQNLFPISAKIFISHPHYDHINGLPFFTPLYMKQNDFDIYGGFHSGKDIKDLLAGQMDSIYFPVTINEFSARIKYHSLREEKFKIGNVHIETIVLNHPGSCLGYKIRYKGKIFCYLTDNELYPENSRFYDKNNIKKLVKFLHNADLALLDSAYTDEEYIDKIGWGHSPVSRAVELAAKANVKRFCLYHHDPGQFDKDIDQKIKQACNILKAAGSKTKCVPAKEGGKIILK